MKVINSFFSYIIIATIVFVIGFSVSNSINAIHQKNITLYHPTMPKIHIDIFSPIVESVLADAK